MDVTLLPGQAITIGGYRVTISEVDGEEVQFQIDAPTNPEEWACDCGERIVATSEEIEAGEVQCSCCLYRYRWSRAVMLVHA